MRIEIFTHYYSPEGNAPASRLSANAKNWAAQGHQVHVITCVPNVPNGIPYQGYKNKLIQHEEMDGVKVTRVWTFLAPNRGFSRRILNYISYMFSALLASLFFRRPDVVVATSPQFFCGWAGLLSSRLHFRRVPFLLEIRDLWPDSIRAVGAIEKGMIIRFLLLLEKWLYRCADHIVTVGPGYWEELHRKKKVPKTKLTVIPNGVDKELFSPTAPRYEIREKYGIGDAVSCAYIGTIGMASGLHTALEAARLLKEHQRDDIKIMLVGDGAIREELQQEAEKKGLDNIIFTGRLPRTEIPELLGSVDIGLVHLKKSDVFERVLPSKIFEMAAMEKPIILGIRGPTAELTERAGSGIVIEPENANAMFQAICRLAEAPELRRRMGQAGRKYMLEHFDRETLAREYLEVVTTVAE